MGSRVARWLPLKKAITNEGSGMCSLLSLVLYLKQTLNLSDTVG
jgi:hypothetical protein